MEVLRRTVILVYVCVCVSAWMPLRVYLNGKFNTLVSMGTSCVLQRAVSMATLFPFYPSPHYPLCPSFPRISSVCS